MNPLLMLAIRRARLGRQVSAQEPAPAVATDQPAAPQLPSEDPPRPESPTEPPADKLELTIMAAYHRFDPIPFPQKATSRLLREVAAARDVTVADLKGPSRHGAIIGVRLEFYYRAIAETDASLPEIGRVVGGRDHTTVLSGARRYCKRNDLPWPRPPKSWGAKRRDALPPRDGEQQ